MIPHLIASINEAREIVMDPSNAKNKDVTQLREACTSLAKDLESPADRLLNQAFQIQDLIIARLGIQLGVFDQSQSIFGPNEVIDGSGCDYALASRTLRALASLGLLDVTKEGMYKLNQCSKPLANGGMVRDGVLLTVDLALKMSANTMAFFEKSGYNQPVNFNRGIFQDTFGTSLSFFDWLQSQPQLQGAFNRFMEATAGDGTPAEWAQWFPIESKFQELYERSQKDKKVFTFVDVGGGHGHEAKAVMSRFPHLPCHFIVQDGPNYVNSHDADWEAGAQRRMKRMEHSFFDKQPVEHAHVYFLGRVLHNWPDDKALQILRNICIAMDPNSVLLIYDWVLSDNPIDMSPEQTRDDWSMMTLFSSPARTESGWQALLHSADLQLVKVWESPASNGGRQASLLEIVVKT